jgi:hypothetical protein
MYCRGPGCTATNLIRAHLTPQSFARLVQGDSCPNLLVSPRRFTKGLPHGLYDPAILCETCDGFLNTQYDDPAFELLQTKAEAARPTTTQNHRPRARATRPAVVPTFGGPSQQSQTLRSIKVLESAKLG